MRNRAVKESGRAPARLRPRRWLVLTSTIAMFAGVLAVTASTAVADPTSDPLSDPNCYSTAGCGNGTSVPSAYNNPVPAAAIGGLPWALPRLGTGLLEDPVLWTVPGLDSIFLAGAATYLSYEVGSSIYHHWFQGHVTDTVTDSHCNSWGWEVFRGDPFGIGVPNGAYLHARCGIGNDDTFAGSPKNSFSTEGQWWSFWTYVISAQGIVHGVLRQIDASYCHGKSPCYTRVASLDSVTNLTGPLSTAPSGTSVSAGWADPSTGNGVTRTANPWNSPPTSPTSQCLQGGVTMPCTSVSPSGGPTSPAGGLPSGWSNDGFANADANYFRCNLSPATFACPAITGDGTDWSTTGGPLITMPDCYGMTVAACESTVDAALAAAGSSATAAFNTTVAPTYNPSLPNGVVTATIAAASTLSDASSVTAEVNEEASPQECTANIENYHKSEHSPDQTYMLSVFYAIKCNFNSPPQVLLSAKAWACTSKPSQDEGAIENGQWGCVLDAAVSNQAVTVNTSGPSTPATLNGLPYDPTKWYISTAFSNYTDPVVFQGWSQAVPPGVYTG
jgi:hypothetical protein